MTESRPFRLALLALFFLSGISGLIYEIVWTRMLVLVFGNTLLATSTVLSAFMGGLAAGSFAFGRFIDRRPRPLIAIYALLEAGIGLYALFFPLFLDLATPLYVGLYRVFDGDLSLLNLARFAVSFALIALPTFLMGATLPVLIKRFARGTRSLGHETGFLYGLNTAGAVVGTVACGYFLLRVAGMERATWVAVAINLGVAALAVVLARSRDERASVAAAAEAAVEHQPQPAPVPAVVRTMVLLGIGLSGFCALAYEVLWARMLNLFLNNNVYSFTAILATFLTGIAIGSLLYARFLSRHRDQVSLFAGLQFGIAALAYATPHLFNLLHGSLFNDFSETLTLAKTAVIMAGPTLLMGISLPAAVEICQAGRRREGSTIGNVYSVNTLGAIAGSFAAGFILIPSAGLHRGLIVVVCLNLIAAFLPVAPRQEARARLASTAVLLALAGALFTLAPETLFRRLFEKSHPNAEILHYTEGRIANVVVYDFARPGYKDLYLNAVEEASSRLWHVQLFKMLGILPPVVHEDPDDALMIAFGAGMSAGASIDHVSSLDCVDLNPDIDGVAEVFRQENLDVINNPKLNRIVNDGRNALLLSPRKYSLIISDATNPKMFDSWTLYSREFYELTRSRLKPGGVFSQWFLIPLPGDALPVILNTFRSVYPHMSLWCIYGSTQCLMLGTPERLAIDYQELAGRLEKIFDSSGLADYGIDSVKKFLSFFMIGEDGLGRLLENVDKVSTDDLPFPQFQITLDDAGIHAALDLVSHQESILPYLTNLGDGAEETARTLSAYRDLSRRLHLGFLAGNARRFREAALLAEAKGLHPDQNVRSALGFDAEKKRYFLARVASHPEDANARNSLGYIFWQEGDLASATRELRRAIELKPDFAIARSNLARVLLASGRFEEAEAELIEVRRRNPTKTTLFLVKAQLDALFRLRGMRDLEDDPDLYLELGRTRLENGEPFEAIEALRRAAELRPDDPAALLALAPILERLELVEEAHRTYARLAALLPQDPTVRAKADLFATLRRDDAARRGWLDQRMERPSLARDEGGHPESCDLALRVWNRAPFEGSVSSRQLRRAAALYEESIAKRQDDLHAYHDAATIYETLGEHGKAAELWRRLREVSPGEPRIRSRIRRLELLAELEDAGKSSPPAAVLSEIGRLFHLEGKPRKAGDFLRRSLDIEPRQAGVWATLARSLVASGRLREALQAASRALAIDPSHPEAASIHSWLREALEEGSEAAPAAG